MLDTSSPISVMEKEIFGVMIKRPYRYRLNDFFILGAVIEFPERFPWLNADTGHQRCCRGRKCVPKRCFAWYLQRIFRNYPNYNTYLKKEAVRSIHRHLCSLGVGDRTVAIVMGGLLIIGLISIFTLVGASFYYVCARWRPEKQADTIINSCIANATRLCVPDHYCLPSMK